MNSTLNYLSFEVYNITVAQNLKFLIFQGQKSIKKSKISYFELKKRYIPLKKAEIMQNFDSA